MAQDEASSPRLKRGPGRPVKHAQPAQKKRKTSTTLPSPRSSSLHSPVELSPAPEKRLTGLPIKVNDSRPLPTLPDAQPLSLPADEYQSIAASAVLHASLERSRLKWVYEGVLQRYWVKPESGKHARPPPPDNPDVKWQKHKGPCRIRIEPHILEAEVYVEEKAKPPPPPPAPVKHYMPPTYQRSSFAQPYRPNHPPPYGQQQQYYHNRAVPPMQHQTHGHSQPNHLPPPINGPAPSYQSPKPPPPPPAPPQQEKKASPDPVISMLANRASSDPELKALMKEVATGNASQEQLKVFQGHIDELTKFINDKKNKEEEEATPAVVEAPKPVPPQEEMIQYDGTADHKPYQRQQPYQPPPAPTYQQPQAWSAPPPAPTSLPVILAFTTPGATEDRFLFPQSSIIEALSPQHLLVSFIITRKGREAVDHGSLEPETEYWQPATLMVEVAYNREHILDCVRKWVKPAEEVKKEMEEVMARCTKAPDTFLALRLPFKGSAMAETEEIVSGSGGRGTPVQTVEEKGRRKSAGQNVKKSSALVKSEDVEATNPPEEEKAASTAEMGDNVQVAAAKTAAVEEAGANTAEVPDAEAPAESGRPRRNTRKSVRISVG